MSAPKAPRAQHPTWEPNDEWAVPSQIPDDAAEDDLPDADDLDDQIASQPFSFAEPPLATADPSTRGLNTQIEESTGQQIGVALGVEPAERTDRPAPVPLPKRYRWVATLGEGGQGSVELVFDSDLGRSVALKTLLPTKQEPRRVADLYREARVTGQLDHPAIIPIFDVGLLPDGRLYYTMPRMPGESLHQVLVRNRRGDGTVARRWPIPALVQALQRAAEGVGYAHERGVIHRDLKPANVLLGGHGEVYVVDWGIARVLDEDRPDRLWSEPGEQRTERVRGSPPYMSPEQIQHPDQVGPAADVFCLGVVLYEILTRNPPFTGRTVDQLVDAVCHQRPVPPRERAPDRAIPAELEEICLAALQKFPGHRPRDGSEFASRLAEWSAGGQRHARATRRLREAEGALRRHDALAEQREAASIDADRASSPLSPASAGPELRATSARHESLSRAAEGTFADAVWAAQRALRDDPEHPEARALLARLYARRFAEAEATGDERSAAFFRAELRQLEDGRWGPWLRRGAELTADGFRLHRLEERDGRLEPVEDLGDAGTWSVAPGRYGLTAGAAWLYPVRVERDSTPDVTLDRTGAEGVGASFAFVPGGPAVLGAAGVGSGPERVGTFPPLAVAVHPVTVGAWSRFLAEQTIDESRHRQPLGWGRQDDEARPVVGVDREDAVAFCRWLSLATRRTVRLPTADEWERAGRGGDGRQFPWGDTLDPSACACLGSCEPDGPAPTVGRFPGDRSPFGVRDLAGGVWEWTAGVGDRGLVVGGAWISEPDACRLGVRRSVRAAARLPWLGFRVVMDVV